MPRKITTAKTAKNSRTKTTAKKITSPATPKSEKASALSKISSIKPRMLVIPGLIILGILIFGLFRNYFISAVVNGEQISRLELLMELEKTEGQRVLQTLVTEKLIEQEANERNLSVSQEEIDSEIAKIEESISGQGQNLDDLLAIQNFTRDQLREQLHNQLLLQKMVDENAVEVTDEEINEYIEQNQDSFPEEADFEEIRSNLSEQLRQQKLNTEVQNLLTQLQSEANIDILLN